MAWRQTGAVDPLGLWDARVQLHWAAQAATGIGRTLIPPRADDSHTAFTWSAPLDALLQEPVDGSSAGLRLRDLALIIARNGVMVSELPLAGRTLDDGFRFLEARFGKPLKRPDVDLPDHPVARGAKFAAAAPHLEELARYYGDAAIVLGDVVAAESRAEPVLCWPHHFDIATLITVSGSGESARTIGIGLAPGDAGYCEPYYYVTLSPYPEPTKLGPLAHGRWNTAGWVGAVLTASGFASDSSQERTVRAFIEEASARCRDALK